jgi:DNA-binding NarL/FixJ family response regulator
VGVLEDGREVADAAARLQPVVIVVDLNLPNVSGLDVCRRITRDHPEVKILVISGLADEQIRDDVLAAGAAGFFDKFAASELVVAIKRLWAESA